MHLVNKTISNTLAFLVFIFKSTVFSPFLWNPISTVLTYYFHSVIFCQLRSRVEMSPFSFLSAVPGAQIPPSPQNHQFCSNRSNCGKVIHTGYRCHNSEMSNMSYRAYFIIYKCERHKPYILIYWGMDLC